MKKTILYLCILLLVGCSSKINYGRYVLDDSHSPFTSWIDIHRDGTYEFNASDNVSYRPSGKFTISSNRLTLHVGDNSSYYFLIDDDTLVYQGSTTEGNFIKKGSIYRFQGTKGN